MLTLFTKRILFNSFSWYSPKLPHSALPNIQLNNQLCLPVQVTKVKASQPTVSSCQFPSPTPLHEVNLQMGTNPLVHPSIPTATAPSCGQLVCPWVQAGESNCFQTRSDCFCSQDDHKQKSVKKYWGILLSLFNLTCPSTWCTAVLSTEHQTNY